MARERTAEASASASSGARSTRRTSATWSPRSTSATSCGLDRVLLVVNNVPWQKAGTRYGLPGRGSASPWSRRPWRTSRASRPAGWRSTPAGPPTRPTRWPTLLAEDPTRELFVILGPTRPRGSSRGSAATRCGTSPRSSSSSGPAPHRPRRRRGGGGRTVEVPSLEVSSTDLRARAVDGRPLDYLVTHEVADWIEAHQLYRDVAVTAPTEEQVRPTAGSHLVPSERRPSRRWMIVFSTLLAVTLVAGGVLAYVGVETVRTSRAGKSVSTVTDPTQPGFEAFLEPTPTLLLIHGVGHAADARSAVLALNSGDVGGSIAARAPGHARGRLGTAPTRSAVVAAFRRSPTAIVPGAADPCSGRDHRGRSWSTTPVGPSSWRPSRRSPSRTPTPSASSPPDRSRWRPTRSARTSTRAAKGRASWRGRLRQQLFFEAWADAVAASSDAGRRCPARSSRASAGSCGGLPTGRARSRRCPVVEDADSQFGERLGWTSTPTAVRSSSPTLVPFPTPATPGRSSPRSDCSTATGDPEHVLTGRSARRAGRHARSWSSGNADAFDYETTEIRYHHPTLKSAAEALQRCPRHRPRDR